MVKDFTRAKSDRVFNRFYALGRVTGYERTTNGMAAFALLIRRGSDQPAAAGRPAARRPIIASGSNVPSGNRELTTTVPSAPAVRGLTMNIAYGRNLKLPPEGLIVGSVIEVMGHITTYIYRNEALNKWDYVQYFEADEIENVPSEFDVAFGTRGYSYPPFYVTVYLKGEVGRILRDNRNSDWTNFSVLTRTGRGSRSRDAVRVQYSSRMRRVNDVGVKMEDGDIVGLIGTVSTTTKADRSGVLKTFENVIVDDIKILEKGKKEAPATEESTSAAEGTPAAENPAPAAEAAETAAPGTGTSDANAVLEEVIKDKSTADNAKANADTSAWPEAEHDDVTALEQLIGEM